MLVFQRNDLNKGSTNIQGFGTTCRDEHRRNQYGDAVDFWQKRRGLSAVSEQSMAEKYSPGCLLRTWQPPC